MTQNGVPTAGPFVARRGTSTSAGRYEHLENVAAESAKKNRAEAYDKGAKFKKQMKQEYVDALQEMISGLKAQNRPL